MRNGMHRYLGRTLLSAICAIGLSAAPRAIADENDSNADADGGFHNTVATSSAVMIRVPVNARNEENTNAAEMRLITHGDRSAPANYVEAWNSGLNVTNQPTVTAESHRDASTRWWGWSNWRGYGWRGGYYNNYRPYYYYSYGYPYYNNYSYYNYGYPYYYNYYYGGYPYYRYYYYPAYW